MTIELMDVDIPYEVGLNVTDEGKDVVEIRPMSAYPERDEKYDIVLDYHQCQVLIRTLRFISNEIKQQKQ